MKVDTINVVEYADDSLLGVTSFSNDEAGSIEAEAHFRAVAKENTPEVTDEEMASFVEEGYHEQGDYQLFLTRS